MEERPESGSGLATRSEGDVSLGGELDGGVAIGAAPPNEGLAVSSAGARGAEGTAIGGGADRTGGADCAWAGSGDDDEGGTQNDRPKLHGTVSCVNRRTDILGNRWRTECRLHGPFVTS